MQAIIKSMFSETPIGEIQTSVVEKPLSPNIILIADGLKVIANGNVLNKNEVRAMMVNTDAFFYYKGLQKAKTGNILLYTSGAFLIPGIVLIPLNVFSDFTITGIALFGVGVGLGISGFVLRSKAKKDIGQAVDMYNGRKKTSLIELGFGATPNGMTMTMKF
jgi:hypothetical protein